MSMRIAHVQFINPDGSHLVGPDTALYVYRKADSGKFFWTYEFLVDKQGRYQNVPFILYKEKDKRPAQGAGPTVQLMTELNGIAQDLWVVCAPRQLTWEKAHEAAEHAQRGARVAPKRKVQQAKGGVPAGSWIVQVDPSGDSLTESGKCEMGRVVLAGSTREIEEKNPVIQVVANGVLKDSYGLATEYFGTHKEFAEFRHKAKEEGSWSKLVHKMREEEAEEKGKQKEWKVNAEKSFAKVSDGHAEISPDVELAMRCSEAHQLQLSGSGSPRTVQPKEKVKLAWTTKEGGIDARAKPTPYTLTAKGCHGKAKNLKVEVFPSDQYLFGWGLVFDRPVGGTEGSPHKITQLFSSVTKKLDMLPGKPDVGFGVAFNIEGAMGWREDSESWKAAYTTEVSLALKFSARAKITFSALELSLAWPQSLTDYLGDIRFTVGVDGSLAAGGTIEEKRFADGEHKGGGSIWGEGTLGIPLQLKGFVGKEGLLAVIISADARPGVRVKAQLAFEEGAAKASVTGKYDKGDITVNLTFDAHVKKKSKDLVKWTLWEEGEIGKLGPTTVWDGHKERSGGKGE